MYAMRIFGETLDRMNSANRRSEFEMATIKVCNPLLSDTNEALLERIVNLERRFTNVVACNETTNTVVTAVTVPVKAETTAVKAESKKVLKSKPVENYADEADTKTSDNETKLVAWGDVMKELQKTCPLMCGVLQDSTAYISGDALLIDCKNTQFLGLIKDKNYREYIRKAALEVLGKNYKLGGYRPKSGKSSQDPLSEIVNKLSELEIPANL